MPVREKIIFDTSFDDLAKKFNIRGLKRVSIPAPLYESFLKLYNRSAALQEKLESIIDDGEHRLALEEGQQWFDLPDPDFLRTETEDLASLLYDFEPFRVEKCMKGHVSLERGQIQGFFNVFAKDADIVEGVLDVIRNTDYILFHKYLKNVQKVKYAGPSSLQEMVYVWAGLKITQRQQLGYLEKLQAR